MCFYGKNSNILKKIVEKSKKYSNFYRKPKTYIAKDYNLLVL